MPESDKYLIEARMKAYYAAKDGRPKEDQPSMEGYCGFSCESLLRKQQRIVDNILDFNRYNPEFSMIMIGKCMKMLYDARNNMIEMKEVAIPQ